MKKVQLFTEAVNIPLSGTLANRMNSVRSLRQDLKLDQGVFHRERSIRVETGVLMYCELGLS